MLLGVRAGRGDELVRAGQRLRVYVPFGTHWYEYSIRRLQENPRIAGYVAADTLRRLSRGFRRAAAAQARSEKPPSTTITWPRIISASGEQRNATAPATSSGATSRPAGLSRPGAEHLLLVREVLERARLDDAGRDGVDADPARRELDGEVADERLERRLRRADQRVVLEHALRAERRDARRSTSPAASAGAAARASASSARAFAFSVQSQCLSSVSSAGRTTPRRGVVDEDVERAERRDLLEHACRR